MTLSEDAIAPKTRSPFLASCSSALNLVAVPAREGFECKELWQADLIVLFGGAFVAIFCALPELTGVGAWEQRFIFLALVHKDRFAFERDITWAERHGDFNLVQGIFLPSPAVQEDFGNRLTTVAHFGEYLENGFSADSMCPVRVREIASNVDLVRTYAFEQLANNRGVFDAHRTFGDGAGAIERQVEKMQILFATADLNTTSPSLTPPNQAFDFQDRFMVRLTGFLFA